MAARWREIDRRLIGIKLDKGRVGHYAHLVYKVWYIRNGGHRAADSKYEIEDGPTIYEHELQNDPELRYLITSMETARVGVRNLEDYLEHIWEKNHGKRNQKRR